MTVGGTSIPRLQEIAYLETVVKAVAADRSLEEIRLAVVDHIWANAQRTAGVDPPDPATFQRWRSDEKKFIHNVADALKELMRLGFVEPAQLPSSGKSAYAHRDARYNLTAAGNDWGSALDTDRRRAYDELIPALIDNHPMFGCFLTVVGTLGDKGRDAFVVPLLRWGELPAGKRSQAAYRDAIGKYVAAALDSTDLGWSAGARDISTAVASYLDRIQARAQARGRDAFPTVRTFTQTCEEALVKLAFVRAGCPVDYTSMEIARRWSRWLGLASFTYHGPGSNALRFWSTANVRPSNGSMAIERHAGNEWRDRALEAVREYCEKARQSGTTYVPVWEVRAAVCWKLRMVDDEFDRAITETIAGQRAQDSEWRVHLDQVSLGSIPSSAAPFLLNTAAVGPRTYNVMTVVPRTTR